MMGKLTSIFRRIFDASLLMVKVLLPRAEFNSSEKADALALALCLKPHRTSLSHRSRVMV
ncbi:Holliday junction resolvasome RuvABC endonuclease subunit [Bartonella callosciuri]|uniref:Holliday junction resolvasome RuvABC endonuclease subunit n=1 Tax=Bartonella callosciuri TaxID=686223 RepID=A0A840NY33_9HYPH|nr:Holliday junction resolvasome RuvABC endonuclease subunit [Bartonella callosciuri]